MLALWLATGFLAGRPEAPPVVARRGDDGGLAYAPNFNRQHFRELALRQFESRLEKVKRKARKARNTPEAISEAVEAVSDVPRVFITQDLLARLDAISAALQRATNERAAMDAVIAQIDAAMRLAEQKRQRRRREEDMVIEFLARLQ